MLQAAPAARDRQSRAPIPLHHLRSSLQHRPTTVAAAQPGLEQALDSPLHAVPTVPFLALLLGLGEVLFFSEPDSRSRCPLGSRGP